jgi:hypothetical protein
MNSESIKILPDETKEIVVVTSSEFRMLIRDSVPPNHKKSR